MAHGALGATHIDLSCALLARLRLQHECLDSSILGPIAQRRRRGVRVDVVDLRGRQLSLAQGLLHREQRAGARIQRGRDVVRVGRVGVAAQLGVDACPAGAGVLEALAGEVG